MPHLTYFVRHSSKLDINQETLDRIWEEDLFGIHYPTDRNGVLGNQDNDSLALGDYQGSARSAMKILQELATQGGYVFASYENRAQDKIGFVKPDSAIRLFEGEWGNKNTFAGRKAILKLIRFSSSKELSPSESILLKAVQPRQGTICRWWAVNNKIERLLNPGEQKALCVDDLTPDQQEVLCSEFLRLDIAQEVGLFKIESLLTPIGRTLKDIDLIGLDESGKRIIAQVTYTGDIAEKLRKLQNYATESNCKVILFAHCEAAKQESGVTIYPIQQVFERYLSTKPGQRWIESVI